jgi:hypothetical protein
MANTSQKTSELKKWNDLYKPLDSGFYVPSADPYAHQPDQPPPMKVVVRDMIVDMEQLNTDLATKAPEWNELEVYADILVFPLYSKAYGGNFAFKLGGVGKQKATFFARSVIVVDGGGAFANFNKETQLTIYTAEIFGGPLYFLGLGGDLRKSAPLELQDGAVGLSISGSDAQAKAVSAVPAGIVAHGAPAYWLLESSFNVGSALAYVQQDLASKILSWTSLTAAFGDDLDTQHLALNAANLQGYVMQLRRKIPFVPVLSKDLYEEVAKGYLDAAADFEKVFNGKVAELDQLKNVDAFVNANKEYFTDQTGVAAKLIEQMQKNVDDAEALLTQNSDKLNDLVKHDGAIDQAKRTFEDGVEKYKEKQKKKAILGVVTAVLEVGASAAAMAAGDEAAVATAAKGATDVAKTGEAVAETVSKMGKLWEAMKKIAGVIKKLSELGEKLLKAKEAIEKLVKADGLKTSDFGKGIKIADDDTDVFDNAYWEVFKVNIDDLLSPYTTGETDIEGASAYLEQLKFLAIYGEAVYANQVTATQFRQKLLQLVLEAKVAENQKGRLEQLTQQEETTEELLQRAKIITYQNLLRVKGRVVFYMDEQAAAYRYWAVEPELKPEWLPSLGDTVGELTEKLAHINEGRLDTLKKFKPAPQPMDVELIMDQTDLIEQMKTSRQLSWTISMNDQREFNFPDIFGRVRVTGFRVYINKEAVTDPNGTITVEVMTSAHYYDRYRNTPVLEYVSAPFDDWVPFKYQSKRKDKPIADGTIAHEFEFSYFEPTPFTTWTFKITEDSPVDLSKLTTVKLQLKGSWAKF